MNTSLTAPAPAQEEGTGVLRIRTYAARDALPVANVQVQIYQSGTRVPLYSGQTDAEGIWDGILLPAPPRALSLQEDYNGIPYSVYDLTANAENYLPVIINNLQMFDGELTLGDIAMEPTSEEAQRRGAVTQDFTDVPPHNLVSKGRSSGSGPLEQCTSSQVLTEVIIPDRITVHLGRPTSAAQDVTVTFRDYIKNVASSEVYPTWPEEALRANIHAQISLALNRVYTEWYRSRGYSFQITNSTSFDQYYVHGRTIFDVMSRITDDIFNTYVRKTGTVNPYFTEYCDGKTVSCKGMKQWGTVTQAQQGKNALQILRFYYGNDIEIVRTNNIARIPESYPGTPLRLGSTGTNVKIIQRQLNRIAKDYPFFGTNPVDGVFGASTESQVKKFQKQFSLAQDGVVGRSTWYKISYIYVAVKDLAELTSEGEKPSGDLVAGVYPGTPLRIGSRGDSVLEMQFWLDEVASFSTDIPRLTVDGIFGVGTDASVRAFQTRYKLTVDGIVGASTWDAIYKAYTSLESDINPAPGGPGAYPGTSITVGSRGDSVRRVQFWLRIVARNNPAIPTADIDGIFGPATERSVLAFQNYYRLETDGIVGRLTWNKMYEVYTNIVNQLMAPSARPGTYPGAPLTLGSTGQSVKEIQYYLYLLSAYYSEIPQIAYDGVFGQSTRTAVLAFQRLFGLTADGIIGPQTWNSIYNRFNTLRNVDGPVQAFRVFAYPGYDLVPGMQGDYVKFAQFILAYIGAFFDAVLPVEGITGIYDEPFTRIVVSFQELFNLPPTGTIDKETWDTMVIVYLSIAADAGEEEGEAAGEYPGVVLVLGSAGIAVWNLQIYMNAIASRYCIADFVPQNGVYDVLTQEGVRAFQLGFGLPVTGIVDRATWEAIYNFYLSLQEV